MVVRLYTVYIYIVFEDHFVILEAFGNVAKMFCTWFFVRIWFAGSEVLKVSGNI
jgi:hypothetical protein